MDLDYMCHLQRVSRSFAFCIARLNSPFKEWVGLTYLLCRLLDTVEDSVWPTFHQQLAAFDEFLTFLERAPDQETVRQWSRPMKDMSEGERLLLQDGSSLFHDFHRLPVEVRGPVAATLKKMARGMKGYSQRKDGGVLRLLNLKEVNDYCYYVAGVVGEGLAKLLSVVEPKFCVDSETVARAHRFGLFLQKVNLLKDENVDRPLGRHLVPNSQELFVSAQEDGRGACEFLQQIPIEQTGFRLFCAWSLSLGLATLGLLRHKQTKLNRADTQRLLTEVEQRIDDPEQLDRFINTLNKQVFI